MRVLIPLLMAVALGQRPEVAHAADAEALPSDLVKSMQRIEGIVRAGNCEEFLAAAVSEQIRKSVSSESKPNYCRVWAERKAAWLEVLSAARKTSPRFHGKRDFAFFNLASASRNENMDVLGFYKQGDFWYIAFSRGVQTPEDYFDQKAWSFAGAGPTGGWRILLFGNRGKHPAEVTQLTAFRDDVMAFKSANAQIIVINDNTVEQNAGVAKWLSTPFSLVADSGNGIATRYGLVQRVDGSAYLLRSTMMIDPDGVVRAIYYGLGEKGQAESILRRLESMRAEGRPASYSERGVAALEPNSSGGVLSDSIRLLSTSQCLSYLQTYEPKIWNPASEAERKEYVEIACRSGNRERMLATYDAATDMLGTVDRNATIARLRIGDRLANPTFKSVVLSKVDGKWSIDGYASFVEGKPQVPASPAPDPKLAARKEREEREWEVEQARRHEEECASSLQLVEMACSSTSAKPALDAAACVLQQALYKSNKCDAQQLAETTAAAQRKLEESRGREREQARAATQARQDQYQQIRNDNACASAEQTCRQNANLCADARRLVRDAGVSCPNFDSVATQANNLLEQQRAAENQRQQQELEQKQQALDRQAAQQRRDAEQLAAARRAQQQRNGQQQSSRQGQNGTGATSGGTFTWTHFDRYFQTIGGTNMNYAVHVQNTGTVAIRCGGNVQAQPAGYGVPRVSPFNIPVPVGQTREIAVLQNIVDRTGNYNVQCQVAN